MKLDYMGPYFPFFFSFFFFFFFFFIQTVRAGAALGGVFIGVQQVELWGQAGYDGTM
jgi:hypothetical protein